MKPFFLLTAALIAAPALLTAQQSTLGEGDSYAWAGNIGWIELIPSRPNYYDGVRVTDTHLSGYGWSDSTGWINFGDGTPANAIRYANTDGADSGVNHDGAGNLSGLAWSANLGWINFGWAAANNPNRPRFDLFSGGFDGYAWSSTAGWVNLSTGILKTDTMAITDTDGDGISDAWERERAGTLPILTATGDADGDGVSDKAEYAADTNPLLPSDRFRVLSLNLNPPGTQLVWTSRPTRLYLVHDSLDLSAWNPTVLGFIYPDAGVQTTRTAPHAVSARRFFKVEAWVPLQP